MVLFDAARADFFGVYGQKDPATPTIDRIAGTAVVFKRHYSNSFNTRTSLSQIFTSRYEAFPLLDYFQGGKQYPWWMRDEILPPDTALLPKVLSASGYHTVMVSAHPFTTTETVFARSFDATVRVQPETNEAFAPAERVFRQAQQVLREHERRSRKPLFVYVHVLDTHLPYQVTGSETLFIRGRAANWSAEERRKRRPVSLPNRQDLDPDAIDLLRAEAKLRYRYLDEQFGRFVRSLEILTRRPFAWLITSDHGDALGEDGYVGHDYGTFAMEVLHHVPLIIGGRGIGLRPRAIDSLTSAVDIFPTLLDITGTPMPRRVRIDGTSLAPVITGRAPPAREGVIEVMRIAFRTSRLAYQTETATYVITEYDEAYRRRRGDRDFVALRPDQHSVVPAAFRQFVTQYRTREARRQTIARGRNLNVPPTEFVLDTTLRGKYDLCWAIPSWRYFQDRLPMRPRPSCPPLRFHVALPDGSYNGQWEAGLPNGACAQVGESKPLLSAETSASKRVELSCPAIASGALPLGGLVVRNGRGVDVWVSAQLQTELWLGSIHLVRTDSALSQDRKLTPEEIQRLRSLGYIQ